MSMCAFWPLETSCKPRYWSLRTTSQDQLRGMFSIVLAKEVVLMHTFIHCRTSTWRQSILHDMQFPLNQFTSSSSHPGPKKKIKNGLRRWKCDIVRLRTSRCGNVALLLDGLVLSRHSWNTASQSGTFSYRHAGSRTRTHNKPCIRMNTHR